MDLLGAQMPIIQPRLRCVLYWGTGPDQPLDFTTKDNVAAYTAAAALDATTPRKLRIAGDTASARQLGELMSTAMGRPFHCLRLGSIDTLGRLIRVAQWLAPQPGAVFPPWQGMQYLRDMYSGKAKLEPLDNERYPDVAWTKLPEFMPRS